MTDHVAFLLLGLGNGAVYAALALALVMTYKSSGVVNFASGSIALYAAYTYAFLRRGELLNPIPGFPATIDVGGKWDVLPAMALSLVMAAVVGALLYALVFRPMRAAPALAKAVASIGLMLVLQALIALRIGSSLVAVAPIFPKGSVTIGDKVVPTDRIWLALLVIAIGVCAGLVFRYTRFGIATEAAAESEKGAYVTGLSPDRIALSNWALSSVIAGLSGILIAPIVPLNPIAYSMFIVPALAAALVANFTGLAAAVFAGLAIGMLQAEATNLQANWDWLPDMGVAEAIPLVLMLVVLLVRGKSLPSRGTLVRQDLGRSPRPRRLTLATVAGALVGIVALTATSGSYRAAVIATMIFAILGLSQVVITGFAGQVSLAQLTLAGVGAFSLSRFTSDLGLPFPIAPIAAALAATVIGVVVGLPSLRVRGLPLMVVTLALAVFMEAFWFRNQSLNGGMEGAPIEAPTLFGIDLGIGAGSVYPRIAFGVVCLVAVILAALAVAWLRRSRLGAEMLAVRANERSAAASGIDVGRTKLTAFAIGSFLAGLAGALMGYQQTLATAGSYTVFAGIALFAVLYIAGVTSITGGLLAGVLAPGGVFYLITDRFLSFGDYYALVSGILLVLTVATSPDGIAGHLHALRLPGRIRTVPRTDVTLGEAGDTALPVPPARAEAGAASGEAVLTVENVTVKYGAVTAVDDVGFEVRRGEILGLIGPNGAGKTTLIDAISGFAPATGTLRLGEHDLNGLAPHRRSRLGLGRTFQDMELYDDLSVIDNVRVGTTSDTDGDADAVERVLRLLGIDAIGQATVAELSVGHRQLVSLARVLAGNPEVALLDEPSAGLDSTESRWLGERLQAARNSGVTMLLVDHDMDLVLSICDRVVVLDLGKVIASGTTQMIRENEDVIRAYLGTGPTAAIETPAPAARSEVAP
ncbi:branched-chain amino acid ABC transporter permease/ATP-binding protein [Aldersonia sp. NBC_00410]|uniref:branched-chain amino acid ABC transporter permease/ATP-binding protein n=1 Tax=Aldersonia sp. NBC_00410 TaxID=2975954 RepID=UPI00224D9670|nr:branched-chain amino acid ABC transporter permease/ATP-binding protein [Aldersonia sp. NBC_00410]MCX5042007.1 branched-chain amino acid ABC transporter permease/ATP-binding protein [Aldersonia sp. NBC_00410]